MLRVLARARDPSTIGVVFDIDDTLIESGPHGKPIEWTRWLYEQCIEMGLRVAIVTARPRDTAHITMTDLTRAGICPETSSQPGYAWLSTMSNDRSDGVPRYKLAQRLRLEDELGTDGILALAVGDQWWDMVGSDETIDEFESKCPDTNRSYVISRLPPREPARYGVRVCSLYKPVADQ